MENNSAKLLLGDHEKKITKSRSASEENHDKGENQKQEDDNKKDISTTTKEHDHEIESARAKMGEVKEENERLKLLLSQIVKDYQSLQTRFNDVLQKEANKSTVNATSSHEEEEQHHHDLISLCLGRSSTSKNEEKKNNKMIISNGKEDDGKSNSNNNGLELGLECKFEPDEPEKINNNPSSESSLGKHDEELEEPTEVWPPSKILKTTMRSGDEEDVSEPLQLKKTRVCVRTRCDTPTMIDGCQWRKYGQKTAKGNPCPRAYYRCTLSSNCPVRKQVQRCCDDMSILITTYEGNHNHPLPLNATAMASTTSAAASMIQSQSSSSQQGQLGTSVSAPSTAPISSSANFNFSQTSRPYQPFNFPNPSISTSNSHPTVTLDLTTPPPNNNFSYFSRFSNVIPRYPSTSTCLNFSSSPSPSSSSSSLQLLSNPQASWKNTSHLTFGGTFPNPINSTFSGPPVPLNYPGRQQSPYMQITNQSLSSDDTITAATKAITANPSFCSALAAALTSFVGNRANIVSGNEVSLSLPMKRAHQDVDNEAGYLGKSSSMNNNNNNNNNPQQQQKQGSLLLFPTSKNSSDPPADSSNHIK